LPNPACLPTMEVYAEGAQIKHERQCPDCRGRDFVEDHAAGDIVCRVRASGLHHTAVAAVASL
jgi:hypothetical protein